MSVIGSPDKKWMDKLYVRLVSEEGSGLVSPIQSIAPVFQTPNEMGDSLEADNVFVTRGNDRYPFTLVCNPLRGDQVDTIKVLMLLGLKHLPFQIAMLERQTTPGGGSEWSLDELVLPTCYCNQSEPSTFRVRGAPVATFNCMSVGVQIDGESYDGTLGVAE